MKPILALSFLAATVSHAEITQRDVINGYVELAHLNYTDALQTAKQLDERINQLINSPSDETFQAAKAAWINARPSYQQSEVFRFSHAVVDDWEGQLNAWPLDEGLIDYVNSDAYEYELGNEGGTANIVNNQQLGDRTIAEITPDTLISLNEFQGSEANVATGYHAIEFLLWGQDLNGHNAGSGNRSWTDYATGEACTNGNCERRGAYLKSASQLLVNDLTYMAAEWSAKGDYRNELLNMDEKVIFNKMLFGMGSLALGELAGERIKVALVANSTEDEHDCFSDNTHNSHYYNAQGVANIYYGTYTTFDGTKTDVASLRDFLNQRHASLIVEADRAFNATQQTMTRLVESAENGVAFDQLIAPGNEDGKKLLTTAIDHLIKETAAIEQLANALGIEKLAPDNAGHDF